MVNKKKMKHKKVVCLFAGISMLCMSSCSYSKIEDRMRSKIEKDNCVEDDDAVYGQMESDEEETEIEKSGGKIVQKGEVAQQVDPYGQEINYTLKNVVMGQNIVDLQIGSEEEKQEIEQALQQENQKDVLLLKAEFELENVNYLGLSNEHTPEEEKYMYGIQNQVIPSDPEQRNVELQCKCIYFSAHGEGEEDYNMFLFQPGEKKKITLVWTVPKELEKQALYFNVTGSIGTQQVYIQLQ